MILNEMLSFVVERILCDSKLNTGEELILCHSNKFFPLMLLPISFSCGLSVTMMPLGRLSPEILVVQLVNICFALCWDLVDHLVCPSHQDNDTFQQVWFHSPHHYLSLIFKSIDLQIEAFPSGLWPIKNFNRTKLGLTK